MTWTSQKPSRLPSSQRSVPSWPLVIIIALSTFVGPIIAMKIHGGSLKEGQEANMAVSWLVSLSAAFKTIDVSGMVNSSLSESLHKRLHFDDLYDWGISKTIAPMARFSAWFDANVIDGIAVSSKGPAYKAPIGSGRTRQAAQGTTSQWPQSEPSRFSSSLWG